jgi:hypothetical protein
MINWKLYDRYNWSKCKQKRMDSAEKSDFEQLAADMLQLRRTDAVSCWGTAFPPGRNSVVFRINPGVAHQFSSNGTSMGIKIFNLIDGETMRRKILKFHMEQRRQFAGLPHPLVQTVLHCGTVTARDGKERSYLVQEWVDGEILEDKLKRVVSREDAWRILDDVFLGLVIPLWGVGSSWWDVRESNYVFTPERRLVMIDSDTVGGYADEITGCPTVFTDRNDGSVTAMTRYSTFICILARYQAPRGKKGKVEDAARMLIKQHLLPCFCRPYPLATGWQARATEAYNDFKTELQAILVSGEIPQKLASEVGRQKRQGRTASKRQPKKNEKNPQTNGDRN